MKLKRQYYNVKDVQWAEKTSYNNGVLYVSKEELKKEIIPYTKNIKEVDFEIVKPGENTRIVHILDTIQPMYKIDGESKQYSGYFGEPIKTGEGTTNLLNGFAVIESAPLPWETGSASSGLLYPRDAILDMQGPIAGFTPFSETINLVVIYDLKEGKSSAEYDDDIRLCGLKISEFLASKTANLEPDKTEEFSIDEINPELPNVVLVWQCQNQGVYANTYLYGHPIDNLVPTLLHPNEMLDGCIVSGNYVWPAFKVPTYLHVNHPIVLELYKKHGKELNFRGVIFTRSHNPSNWHKRRSAEFSIKLAQYLDTNGLIMAWEGGGNAAVDGMLTIQGAEKRGIKASTITFEFGGKDGTEGTLLVDDVPEANAVISGGSIEKDYILPTVSKSVGGNVLRLNKEMGGYFPEAIDSIEFDTTTHLYLAGNQSGHSKLFSEQY